MMLRAEEPKLEGAGRVLGGVVFEEGSVARLVAPMDGGR